jgi:hypothetical protein
MPNWGWYLCIVFVTLYLLIKVIDSCYTNKGK